MPRFDTLTAAIASYRKMHGPRADNRIRARTTGDINIDSASDEMLERALEGQTNTSTTVYNRSEKPKSIHDLNHKAIWDRFNNPPRPKPEG